MTQPENQAEEFVVFSDATSGEMRYGRIDRRYGSDVIIQIVTEEEAGPNPRRITVRPGSYGPGRRRGPERNRLIGHV
jgi:hypothetical protein